MVWQNYDWPGLEEFRFYIHAYYRKDCFACDNLIFPFRYVVPFFGILCWFSPWTMLWVWLLLMPPQLWRYSILTLGDKLRTLIRVIYRESLLPCILRKQFDSPPREPTTLDYYMWILLTDDLIIVQMLKSYGLARSFLTPPFLLS